MIGDAVLYAASRATHSALENVSRRVTWTAIAAVFLLAAMVLAIIAAYLVAEPKFGTLRAIGMLAGACALVGILALSGRKEKSHLQLLSMVFPSS
jgi:quinol-cytochrome oxidoreductase complex cytochrome b subunit